MSVKFEEIEFSKEYDIVYSGNVKDNDIIMFYDSEKLAYYFAENTGTNSGNDISRYIKVLRKK